MHELGHPKNLGLVYGVVPPQTLFVSCQYQGNGATLQCVLGYLLADLLLSSLFFYRWNGVRRTGRTSKTIKNSKPNETIKADKTQPNSS